MMLVLELPYPPSVNNYLKMKDVSTRFICPKARRFRQEVGWIVRQQFVGAVVPMVGRLQVEVKLYPKDNKRRDIDNPIKFLLDSLQVSGLMKDDSQIDRLLVERCEVYAGGKSVVTIAPLEVRN